MRRRRKRRRETNKIVEEGIITLRREIIKLRKNIKIVVVGIKNRGKILHLWRREFTNEEQK